MHCNARYFAQQQIMLLLANILSLDGGWREEESMSSHMVFSRKVSSTLSSTNLLTNVGNSKIDQNWLYIEQIRVSPKTTSYQKLGNITFEGTLSKVPNQIIPIKVNTWAMLLWDTDKLIAEKAYNWFISTRETVP